MRLNVWWQQGTGPIYVHQHTAPAGWRLLHRRTHTYLGVEGEGRVGVAGLHQVPMHQQIHLVRREGHGWLTAAAIGSVDQRALCIRGAAGLVGLDAAAAAACCPAQRRPLGSGFDLIRRSRLRALRRLLLLAAEARWEGRAGLPAVYVLCWWAARGSGQWGERRHIIIIGIIAARSRRQRTETDRSTQGAGCRRPIERTQGKRLMLNLSWGVSVGGWYVGRIEIGGRK